MKSVPLGISKGRRNQREQNEAETEIRKREVDPNSLDSQILLLHQNVMTFSVLLHVLPFAHWWLSWTPSKQSMIFSISNCRATFHNIHLVNHVHSRLCMSRPCCQRGSQKMLSNLWDEKTLHQLVRQSVVVRNQLWWILQDNKCVPFRISLKLKGNLCAAAFVHACEWFRCTPPNSFPSWCCCICETCCMRLFADSCMHTIWWMPLVPPS